ncbi:MAG: hypothetical protein JNK05_03620 [Myxococcales bacterium]|nr:hypothetical protein [Myxococcales bacterium]
MSRVARALCPILLSAFGAHSSGCLLDRRIVGEDEYLTPLSPPVIVTQRRAGTMTLTDPLPGEIIVVPTSAMTGAHRQTFRVTVFYEFPVALRIRGWINRNLDTCISGRTCGVELADPFPSLLQPPDGGTYRTFSFERTFDPATCSRVDIYLSPRLRDTVTQEHLPVRNGEVAHARWYVVVPSSTGTYPPLDACRDVTMSM